MQASEELLKEHYIALRDRPFYGRLVKYMSSGPIVAMVSLRNRDKVQGVSSRGSGHSASKVISPLRGSPEAVLNFLL